MERSDQLTECQHLDKQLAHVEKLILLEKFKKVDRAFEKLLSSNRPANEQRRIEVLQCRHLLWTRRLAPLLARVEAIRREVVLSEHVRELDLLESHARALLGSPRQAFGMLARLLRGADRFSEAFARASYVAGLCCYRMGHYEWAQSFSERGLAYYRLTANDPMSAHVLINLALIAKSRGLLEMAMDLLDHAGQLIPKHEMAQTRLRILVNRGMVLLKKGELQKALDNLMAATEQLDVSENRVLRVHVNTNLGHIYRMQGDYRTASEFYEASLADSKVEGSRRQASIALEFLGQTAMQAGNLAAAEQYLSRAYELAKEVAPKGDLVIEILRRLGELHYAKLDTRRARTFLESAIKLCQARGEEQEELLAKRSLLLANWNQTVDAADQMHSVLCRIQEIGDKYEYMYTVYEILRSNEIDSGEEWVEGTINTALFYLDGFKSKYWQRQFARVSGTARRKAPSRGMPEGTSTQFLASESPAFNTCLELARMAKQTSLPVMILGETGVGKEVLAKWIHSQGSRALKPLISINCGALPESLVESELFGHVRGTFTGAFNNRVGLFEEADRGTVFLDEIGELPLPMQVKVLRFLDSGEFRRVGDSKTRHADVRLMAATNRNLGGLVDRGEFRSDLLFRLNIITIEIPPLRHRREDILGLANMFLEQECRGRSPRLSDTLTAWLRSYGWPGNIRELKNVCQYLSVRGLGQTTLDVDDLPDRLKHEFEDPPLAASDFDYEKAQLERSQIIEALRRTDGVISAAAKLMRTSRNTMAAKIREYRIDKERYRKSR